VINRLAVVRNAQRFGFSLTEIAGFLRVRDAGGKPCHDVRAGAQRLLQAVDQQIAALTKVRRDVRRTLRVWDRKLEATSPSELAHLLESGHPRSRSSVKRAP
jgi:DNA-binding transcriptional MerR regulator